MKVYLAFASSAVETLKRHAADQPVHVLVALPELRSFQRHRAGFNVASWCMDSGAFSAHNSGKTITLANYLAAAKSVDGDPAATRRNLEATWAAGVKAIPTFHRGSPWSELTWCARHAPKIALGGVARVVDKRRIEWAAQAFARVWPHRIHGFGMASWAAVRALPFDSVDASSWCYAPARMGQWAGYSGRQQAVRTRTFRDYWIEVVEHQRRERWATWRWREAMKEVT